MGYLNSSFNQVRLSKELKEYTTFPNGLVVFERNSGEMRILSTEEMYEDTYTCYTIDALSLSEFFKKCKKFEKDNNLFGGKLYTIDLWKVETDEDSDFNDRLIKQFSNNPKLMFGEE